MLVSLSIKNYALIDSLQVNFYKEFSIITGETGAGKSILLGGLALILGKRADLLSLKDKTKKCIIEGEFLITKFNLKTFFEENDLDFYKQTIIRREILPSGKSRAFVNDTPTTLAVLAALGAKLIDIHSQHQTLQLANADFQFLIIDALAENQKHLESYKKGLVLYKSLSKALQQITDNQQQEKEQYDYHSFLLKELVDAEFKPEEQKVLENTLEELNHIEDIKSNLSEAIQLSDKEDIGLLDGLRKYTGILQNLSDFSKTYSELFDRVSSLKIDFEDIVSEIERLGRESSAYFPQEIEYYNDRLQLLYSLQKKHKVNSIKDLAEVQQTLTDKVGVVENASELIAGKELAIAEVESKLNKLAKIIHSRRHKAIKILLEELKNSLTKLGMPHTTFKIELDLKNNFLSNGKDMLEFLIATNKGSDFKEIKKIASGGEMSRIMLSIKAILSNYSSLPTIIFDEIDTGVSGEISNRIAKVMLAMSENMQVLAITHLPQIAAKGKYHYKVFKTEKDNKTITNMKELSDKERVKELAEMLSGKAITDSAMQHAKQLLKQG